MGGFSVYHLEIISLQCLKNYRLAFIEQRERNFVEIFNYFKEIQNLLLLGTKKIALLYDQQILFIGFYFCCVILITIYTCMCKLILKNKKGRYKTYAIQIIHIR